MELILEKLSNKKFTLLKNLQSIYGIGKNSSKNFHKKLGFNVRKSTLFISKKQKKIIANLIKKLVVNQKLLFHLKQIHDFAFNLKSYKGIRNKYGLPSRGQQTRTNAKTKKKLKIKENFIVTSRNLKSTIQNKNAKKK